MRLHTAILGTYGLIGRDSPLALCKTTAREGSDEGKEPEMKPLQYASTFDRLRNEPAWRLLTANLASEVLALLQHLLNDTDRVLPGSVLTERLATELSLMRSKGHELSGVAAYYVRDWLKEGWLERHLSEDAGEEEYELSTAALEALRVVNSLHTQRPLATESRLALVMASLETLARDTDDDDASRLERLYEERKRIDEQIDAVTHGEAPIIDPERAVERVREVIGLARELSEDFRRVRQQFTDLNREFREKIIQDEGSRGQVLADLFAGRDVIAESSAGKTFSAFWSLLTDPEQSTYLETSLDSVTRREFMRLLPKEDRVFLTGLTRTLLDRAGSVNNVQTGFAKSLRVYVQSREYQEHRRLTKLLHSAKSDALAVRGVLRPEKATGMALALSSGTFHSIGRWKLFDPPLTLTTHDLEAAEEAEISLEAVQAAIEQGEIDFRTLYANLQEILMHQSQITIGGLMEAYPPAQGLGTVVGYLSIGAKHGEFSGERTERVHWASQGGTERVADIPLVYFVAERREEIRG